MRTIRVLTCGVLAAIVAACGRDRPEQESSSNGGLVQGSAAGVAADADMTTPQPDGQMRAVLDELASLGGKPIETLTPLAARTQPTPTDAVKALLRERGLPTTPEPGVRSVDRTIPGPAGPLPVRVYTPQQGSGPFPLVVYYHGGGWVIANREVYDAGARGLSRLANAVVVSVDYRLGPEHKFPAAHDDAYAAYRWALAHADELKADGKRVALAGESAGGGLAIATAIRARDERVQAPLHVVSVYPIAGTDTTTPSYVENATAKPLNRPMMSWFFQHYLRNESDRADPRVNLVGADLRGLAPTTIINAEIDPLRSEGEALAQRMRDAGVAVDQLTYPGTAHEFFGMAAVVDKARQAQERAASALRGAFER